MDGNINTSMNRFRLAAFMNCHGSKSFMFAKNVVFFFEFFEFYFRFGFLVNHDKFINKDVNYKRYIFPDSIDIEFLQNKITF